MVSTLVVSNLPVVPSFTPAVPPRYITWLSSNMVAAAGNAIASSRAIVISFFIFRLRNSATLRVGGALAAGRPACDTLTNVTATRCARRSRKRVAGELLISLQFGDGGFGEHGKRDSAAAGRNAGGRHGIADHGGAFVQSLLPAGTARIAQNEPIGLEAGSRQECAGVFEKGLGARGHRYQQVAARAQPGLQRYRYGTHMQGHAVGARRQSARNRLRIARHHHRNCPGE